MSKILHSSAVRFLPVLPRSHRTHSLSQVVRRSQVGQRSSLRSNTRNDSETRWMATFFSCVPPFASYCARLTNDDAGPRSMAPAAEHSDNWMIRRVFQLHFRKLVCSALLSSLIILVRISQSFGRLAANSELFARKGEKSKNRVSCKNGEQQCEINSKRSRRYDKKQKDNRIIKQGKLQRRIKR